MKGMKSNSIKSRQKYNKQTFLKQCVAQMLFLFEAAI